MRFPPLHCPYSDIVRKAEHYLGGKMDAPPAVHMVRDVAPNKIMLCLSFRVPPAVAFNGRTAGAGAAAGGDAKRQKTSE